VKREMEELERRIKELEAKERERVENGTVGKEVGSFHS